MGLPIPMNAIHFHREKKWRKKVNTQKSRKSAPEMVTFPQVIVLTSHARPSILGNSKNSQSKSRCRYTALCCYSAHSSASADQIPYHMFLRRLHLGMQARLRLRRPCSFHFWYDIYSSRTSALRSQKKKKTCWCIVKWFTTVKVKPVLINRNNPLPDIQTTEMDKIGILLQELGLVPFRWDVFKLLPQYFHIVYQVTDCLCQEN